MKNFKGAEKKVLTGEIFRRLAEDFFRFTSNPVARYKTARFFMRADMASGEFSSLREEFLSCDVVRELYELQDDDGLWGPMFSKDYSEKAKIPTTSTGITRCLYLGLERGDLGMLDASLGYLHEALEGKHPEASYEKNERAPHALQYMFAGLAEAINPGDTYCDNVFYDWLDVVSQTFSDGTYSYERERAAQNRIFGIKGSRLIPIPVSFLTRRADFIPPELCDAMRDHFCPGAYERGYFWDKGLAEFPDDFKYKFTWRWFPTMHYINAFRDTEKYMGEAVHWLLSSANCDGFWDWGTQVKDPWGYFGYLETGRNTPEKRLDDTTMQVLDVLYTYLVNNDDY